jgi:hypothetical protein
LRELLLPLVLVRKCFIESDGALFQSLNGL